MLVPISFLLSLGALLCSVNATPTATPHAAAWWKPAAGTTWQITLSEPLKNTSWVRQAYDFDLFDNPASTVKHVHDLHRRAICYFSAGSYENWRPDAHEFKPSDLGKPLDGWPGERWLNTNSANVRRIMVQRMQLAKEKGCDALDPDNVDGYDNDNDLGLTKADAANYVHWLAHEGHSRGMAVGLKNAGEIVEDVLASVDFQVNEQCAQYDECNTFRPFIEKGKPVFHIEYPNVINEKTVHAACDAPGEEGFSTLIKHLNLGKWAVICPR